MNAQVSNHWWFSITFFLDWSQLPVIQLPIWLPIPGEKNQHYERKNMMTTWWVKFGAFKATWYHEGIEFFSDECGETVRKIALQQHKENHHGRDNVSCDRCGKTFKHRNVLLKHECGEKKVKYQCDQCEWMGTKSHLHVSRKYKWQPVPIISVPIMFLYFFHNNCCSTIRWPSTRLNTFVHTSATFVPRASPWRNTWRCTSMSTLGSSHTNASSAEWSSLRKETCTAISGKLTRESSETLHSIQRNIWKSNDSPVKHFSFQIIVQRESFKTKIENDQRMGTRKQEFGNDLWAIIIL